jgi:hypothetical protein
MAQNDERTYLTPGMSPAHHHATPTYTEESHHETKPWSVASYVSPMEWGFNPLVFFSTMATLTVLIAYIFGVIEVVADNFVYQGYYLVFVIIVATLFWMGWLASLFFYTRAYKKVRGHPEGGHPYTWRHIWTLSMHFVVFSIAIGLFAGALGSWQRRFGGSPFGDRVDVESAPSSPASLGWTQALLVTLAPATILLYAWIKALVYNHFAEIEVTMVALKKVDA